MAASAELEQKSVNAIRFLSADAVEQERREEKAGGEFFRICLTFGSVEIY